MNKILISLIVVLSTMILSAQSQVKADSSSHLTFKGVPINGTLNEYISKMKKTGFIHKGTVDGTAILEGDFASYKSYTVGVSTLKKKDLVNKIGVMFPDRDTWSSLSSNYFNLKEMLTEKYGEPLICVEKFQSYTPDDDGTKMHLVELGSCEYYTTYATEKGTIQLSIEHDGINTLFC